MAKLTLYMDDEQVLTKAKAYAKAQGLSLSKLVAQYFATLPEEEGDFFRKLHAKLHAKGFMEPTDEELDAARWAYLQEKYQ
jgi:hypothetical protein